VIPQGVRPPCWVIAECYVKGWCEASINTELVLECIFILTFPLVKNTFLSRYSQMGFPEDAVLPQGSLVLVTGATGYVASILVEQLLAHGYRVRGTVRDVKSDKASWMPGHFEKRYGPGKFEMVEVPDLAVKGSLDDAVKGTQRQ